jgi:hypothetical protein
MTTEQMEAAAGAMRLGSGFLTKVIRQQHPCVKPNPAETAMLFKAGTEWTCDCGSVFVLHAGNQRDPEPFFWTPITKVESDIKAWNNGAGSLR